MKTLVFFVLDEWLTPSGINYRVWFLFNRESVGELSSKGLSKGVMLVFMLFPCPSPNFSLCGVAFVYFSLLSLSTMLSKLIHEWIYYGQFAVLFFFLAWCVFFQSLKCQQWQIWSVLEFLMLDLRRTVQSLSHVISLLSIWKGKKRALDQASLCGVWVVLNLFFWYLTSLVFEYVSDTILFYILINADNRLL